MDLLSPLFARFSLSARVFYSGALCGIVDFDNSQGIGILHVLRRGRLRVVRPAASSIEVTEPSLLQKWIAGFLVVLYALITITPLIWIIEIGRAHV